MNEMKSHRSPPFLTSVPPPRAHTPITDPTTGDWQLPRNGDRKSKRTDSTITTVTIASPHLQLSTLPTFHYPRNISLISMLCSWWTVNYGHYAYEPWRCNGRGCVDRTQNRVNLAKSCFTAQKAHRSISDNVCGSNVHA